MQSGVEISGKYHTLLEMARSDLFSIGMLLHYLKDTYKEEGVLDFLVNILYKYSDKEAMFFIPEFW